MAKGTLDVINRLLRQPLGASNMEVLGVATQQFIVANKDPMAVPSVQLGEKVDDLGAILAVLESEELLKNPILVLVLKVLKVLMRKQANRWALGRAGVRAVTALMGLASLDAVLCECANVVLNMCYDSENVRHFLEVGGMPALAPLIQSEDERLKTSGLGALQSVCFDKLGRRETRDSGMIGVVVRSLENMNPKVRARALGTMHNLSTDTSSIGIIRQEGGLPILVRLLRSYDAHTCGGAASIIQNVSREERSRTILTSFGAVEPLADLLVGRNVKSQISAAGALLNIIGPDVRDIKLLHRVLTDGIVFGIIESCMI